MIRLGIALLGAALAGAPAIAAGPDIVNAAVRRLDFDRLDGWARDDHAAAFKAFRRTCLAMADGAAAVRSAVPPSGALVATCLGALTLPPGPDAAEARSFFERDFEPYEIVPPSGAGFLTGYFEPEIAGSPVRTPDFTAPLLARPDDLVSFAPDEAVDGRPPGVTAGRRTGMGGGVEPYPDRAAIEDGAIDRHTRPVVWLRDGVDAFVVHVQGSARIRLPDGKTLRVAYAGRNGWPYTSVARLVVERLNVPPGEMTADRLTAWLRQHPYEALPLLRANRSFIFFRAADELDPAEGPLGAAGIPVTPGRSLAVDRTVWSFGLPVWLEVDLPRPDTHRDTVRRLVVAQDTGAAITGPARGDLFVGSGEAAGLQAGLIRDRVRFVVLWPREPGRP